MQLMELMRLLGLGPESPSSHTLGDTAYYGGLDRQPYQGDPRFMPSQQTDPMMGMDPALLGADPAMMGGDPLGMQQAPPADLATLLGGLGLG